MSPIVPTVNSPSPDVREHPRERILQVSLNLFTKYGYEATSINDIRKEAGFKSKASLYAHFKSKEEISNELKTHILQQIEQVLFEASEVAKPEPLSQFIEVMKAYIRWGLTYRQEFVFRLIRAQEEKMLTGKYDWQNGMDRSNVYTLLLGIIKQLQRKEYPVRYIPEAALFHMIIGAVTRAVIDQDSFGDKSTDEKTDLVLEACMGIVFSQPVNLRDS